jgi:hypothetical protein
MRLVDKEGVVASRREEAADINVGIEKIVKVADDDIAKLRIGERKLIGANGMLRGYFLHVFRGNGRKVE